MAPTTLLDLPTELLLQITSCLRYHEHVALFMTCRLLHSTVSNPNIPSLPNVPKPHQLGQTHPAATSQSNKTYDMHDLLHIELWPCYTPTQQHLQAGPRDFFACCYCLKLRPALSFSNAMMKGQRGKAGWASVAQFRMMRFCIPCGIKAGRYLGGTGMYFGGLTGGWGVVCRSCLVFKRGWGVEAASYSCDTCPSKTRVGNGLEEDSGGSLGQP